MLSGPFPPALGYVVGLSAGVGLAFVIFKFLPMKLSIVLCVFLAVPALIYALQVDVMTTSTALAASLPGMVLGASLTPPKLTN